MMNVIQMMTHYQQIKIIYVYYLKEQIIGVLMYIKNYKNRLNIYFKLQKYLKIFFIFNFVF